MHKLNFIMKKYLTNPDQGTFYKITDPDSSKVSMSYKTKTDRGVVID